MTKSNLILPPRLADPLYRSKTYVARRSGLEDPAQRARLDRRAAREPLPAAPLAGAMAPGMIMPYAGIGAAPVGWLKCDGSAVAKASYSALWAALNLVKGTFTVTIATPAVFTLNSHGLVVGDQVFLNTTGALPTNLAADTNYFVVVAAANTFQVSATRGGASINTTGSQSGTHTITLAPYGISGASNFLVPDLRGRAIVGQDTSQTEFDALGETGGAKAHTLTATEMPAHTHTYTRYTQLLAGLAGGGAGWAFTGDIATGSAGSGGAHNNLQPYMATQLIIKI